MIYKQIRGLAKYCVTITILIFIILLLTSSVYSFSFILPDGMSVETTLDNAAKYISKGDIVEYSLVAYGRPDIAGTAEVMSYNKTTGMVTMKNKATNTELGLSIWCIMKIVTDVPEVVVVDLITQLTNENNALKEQVNALLDENTKLKSQLLEITKLLTEAKNTLALLLSKLMKF